MKLRSGSIDNPLNELQFVLAQKWCWAAKVTLREVNRKYRELFQYYLRVLRAADRGAFDPRTVRARMHKECN